MVLLFAPGSKDVPGASAAGILRFSLWMSALMIGGFTLMLYAGPLAVGVANIRAEPALEYRLLRGSVPWKYIGFVLGGLVAMGGVICLAERRITWAAFAIAGIAVLGMIAVFDVLFDDLLLPPNGDY